MNLGADHQSLAGSDRPFSAAMSFALSCKKSLCSVWECAIHKTVIKGKSTRINAALAGGGFYRGPFDAENPCGPMGPNQRVAPIQMPAFQLYGCSSRLTCIFDIFISLCDTPDIGTAPQRPFWRICTFVRRANCDRPRAQWASWCASSGKRRTDNGTYYIYWCSV